MGVYALRIARRPRVAGNAETEYACWVMNLKVRCNCCSADLGADAGYNNAEI